MEAEDAKKEAEVFRATRRLDEARTALRARMVAYPSTAVRFFFWGARALWEEERDYGPIRAHCRLGDECA